ncbi:hypothetical protein GRI44_13195 [Altererythrobacter confluentis]|uniref:Uncharacterized protein n=1 Tax=Allopontixanthobacter confluentis TaxID=1849021 RepID=A0A6L7GJF0_9SPHN|nr:hypothetical protein [Allopontixanthobacter confluentis]MXP15705.1 hypothetical protein [Allopontixanthobacter confluentis]
MTDAVKALYGEWQPLSGPGISQDYRLTIWSPMFSWGAGCTFSQGQLSDLGDDRYGVEPMGGAPLNCREVDAIAPFDGEEVRIVKLTAATVRVERGNDVWMFEKVDTAATIPRDDFIRGDWLLADSRGRPYRGDELTRVSFGPEYSVKAANCSFAANGWFGDRDGEVRVGGSYYRLSEPCRVRSLGDRMAKIGAGVTMIAEPVETRIAVRIGAQRATLVPAARFPGLAPDAVAIDPHPWSVELAEVAARMTPEQRSGLALRAIGIGGEGLPGVEGPADPRALSFAGISAWHYAQAQAAGLLPAPSEAMLSLAENFAIAPIVVRAELEGIRPADRGDGLSLDYLYRVRERWRGGNRTGDLLIVRMPSQEDKSRSLVITPEPGAEVLLLASRTGYLARSLMEGNPPSADTRIVQMTLPLMRIEDGKLVEAIKDADVLGAAQFAGTPIEDARALALTIDGRLTEIAPSRPSDIFGNPTVRRYFITRIGDRKLTDPTRLWLDYDGTTNFGNPNGYGGVTAYFDGCTPVSRQTNLGNDVWGASAIACPGNLQDGSPVTELAVGEVVRWINANLFPDVICVSTCPVDPDYSVPLPGGDVVLKPLLR